MSTNDDLPTKAEARRIVAAVAKRRVFWSAKRWTSPSGLS